MSGIITALDFPQPSAAMALAEQLDPQHTRVKIGKQLFTCGGPMLVEQCQRLGFDVFLDLKFHDIPNTVAGAVAAAQSLGVWMVNVHAAGGSRMLEAARAAVKPLASGGGTRLIAVTVLTSFTTEDLHGVGVEGSVGSQVERLTRLAQQSGLDGVVCSPHEFARVRACTDASFLTVTPGIRPQQAGTEASVAGDDQRRVMTPAEALRAGVDHMVIGRPITQAADPQAALAAIVQQLQTASDSASTIDHTDQAEIS